MPGRAGMERGGPAWVGVWALASLLLVSSGLRGDAATPDELLTAIGLERAKEVVQAPEFTLADLAGRPVSAQAFRGNVVLLTFWASHCDVCLELLPSVEHLYQRFKDRGFAAVAISIDVQGAKAVRPEVEKRGWSFPVLLDPQFETIRKFGTRVIPASYLIDQQGTIISSFLAPRDWDSEEDFELIEFLLTHPPAP